MVFNICDSRNNLLVFYFVEINRELSIFDSHFSNTYGKILFVHYFVTLKNKFFVPRYVPIYFTVRYTENEKKNTCNKWRENVIQGYARLTDIERIERIPIVSFDVDV